PLNIPPPAPQGGLVFVTSRLTAPLSRGQPHRHVAACPAGLTRGMPHALDRSTGKQRPAIQCRDEPGVRRRDRRREPAALPGGMPDAGADADGERPFGLALTVTMMSLK